MEPKTTYTVKTGQISARKEVIRIRNLKKGFGDNQVLRGFNLTLYEGENLVVMGKSGSGKTVMIKCLVGLVAPDEGLVEVLGRDISTLGQKELDLLRSDIGFLFQGSALLRFYDGTRETWNFRWRHREKLGVVKGFTSEGAGSPWGCWPS